MTRTDFESGIQRLYYVAWACWVAGWCVVGGDILWNNMQPRDPGAYNLHSFTKADVATWIGMAIVFPPVFMLCVRWIYRGFMPKVAKSAI